MVGVPRSTGCKICIKRRIKCDEARPECANCIKYGTTCPGYDKGLKFVVGKPHRTRRQRTHKAEKIMTLGSSSEERSPSPTEIIRPDFSRLEMNSSILLPTPIKRRKIEEVPFLPSVIEFPESYQLQLITTLVDNLPKSGSTSDILVIARWLSFLPGRFGKSKALDAAMTCFTTQQIGTACDDQQMLRYGRSSYVQALVQLQKALNSPLEAVTSETQCAAMLLCVYELFAGTTAFHSWTTHAAGISRLMQHRGPDEFYNEFDHSMLVAFRGIITMECMFNGKKCFLAEEDWKKVARARNDCCVPERLHGFFEEFISYMALMPELLRDSFELREANKFSGVPPKATPESELLVSKAMDLYRKYRTWGNTLATLLPPPGEVPSKSGDPVFPVVFTFLSHSVATLHCAYWACMIIVQEILMACGCMPEDALDGDELVNNICKSVEYNAAGTWGPYRMAFSLRLAFELADPVVRAWIGGWHERWSKTYAATSPDALHQDPFDQRSIRSPSFQTTSFPSPKTADVY